MTLDELVDIAFLNVDRVEFCQAIADTAGSPELQYEVFDQGFANAGEEFGYSTREVFDAMVARC